MQGKWNDFFVAGIFLTWAGFIEIIVTIFETDWNEFFHWSRDSKYVWINFKKFMKNDHHNNFIVTIQNLLIRIVL